MKTRELPARDRNFLASFTYVNLDISYLLLCKKYLENYQNNDYLPKPHSVLFLYSWEFHTCSQWNLTIYPPHQPPLSLCLLPSYAPTNNSRSTVSGARMCMSVKSSTGAWESYQWSHHQRRISLCQETTHSQQHFSEEQSWSFPTPSMLRFWCCAELMQVTTAAMSSWLILMSYPETSFPSNSLHPLALKFILPSLLQHSLSLPWSRVGMSLVHLLKISHWISMKLWSQAVIIPVLTEGGSASLLTHEFISRIPFLERLYSKATLSTLACGPLHSRVPWSCLTWPEERSEKIQK